MAQHIGNLNALDASAPCYCPSPIKFTDRIQHRRSHAALAVLDVIPQRLSQLSTFLISPSDSYKVSELAAHNNLMWVTSLMQRLGNDAVAVRKELFF